MTGLGKGQQTVSIWILLLTLLSGAPSFAQPTPPGGFCPDGPFAEQTLRIPEFHLSQTYCARHQALSQWSNQLEGVRNLIMRHTAGFLQAQASFYNQGQWTLNRPFLLGNTERFLFFL